MLPTLSETYNYALQNVVAKLIQFIPSLLTAIVIILIGWLLATLVARSVNRILRLLKADKVFAQVKIDDILKNAGSKRDAVALLAYLVKWVLLLVVFMSAVDTLKLKSVSQFFDRIVAYIPNVLSAVLILLIGAILANAADRLVEGALKVGKVGFGQPLSEVAKYSIYVFTIIASLSQLGIASDLMKIFFSGLVAMFAIAGGLSFGLGGHNAARDFIEKIRKATRKKS